MLEQQSIDRTAHQPSWRPERRWRISGLGTCRAPRTRHEPPAATLRHLFTSYEIWSPATDASAPDPNLALWVMPGEARLVMTQGSGRLSAVIGNRRYDGLPEVVLFGPTSRTTRLSASEGSVVTICLSALGWAGLVGRSAAALGDRVVTAADVFDGRLMAALAHAIAGGVGDGIADRLDAALGASPAMGCPDEPVVLGLTEIIEEGIICVAEEAGRHLGVASHVVRRSALRHFGYPPKVLLNRRRFVHALERMIVANRGYSEAARHGYFDASHFIRDARRFLGMTPRRFLALAS